MPILTGGGTGAGANELVNVVAASGAAQTIADPATTGDTLSVITMTASCTFTFPPAAKGKSFGLQLVQGGSGSYTATWPGTVYWAGGTAPTLSTSVGAIDVLTFVCIDGAKWMGFASGLNMQT